MNLNKVFILGRITKDPEIRAMPSGAKVASFGMATNRFYKAQDGSKKDEAEFHNIVLFGKVAEIAERYVKRGGLLLVEGRLKTQSWEKDGVKKYKTEIVGETIQLGPRPAGAVGQATTEKQNNGEATSEELEAMEKDKGGEIDVNSLEI